MELLRYEYDADLPTQPEHELVVYSLKDNSVVEKIISDFQSAHPDVLVKHEVGMGDSSLKDETDAISSLNTEIMAGNGPDVLLLNGLPWKSYQEKGILHHKSHLRNCSIFRPLKARKAPYYNLFRRFPFRCSKIFCPFECLYPYSIKSYFPAEWTIPPIVLPYSYLIP